MQKVIANNTSSLNNDVTAMLCDANLDFVSILLNTAHFGRLCWNNVVSDIGEYYMKRMMSLALRPVLRGKTFEIMNWITMCSVSNKKLCPLNNTISILTTDAFWFRFILCTLFFFCFWYWHSEKNTISNFLMITLAFINNYFS